MGREGCQGVDPPLGCRSVASGIPDFTFAGCQLLVGVGPGVWSEMGWADHSLPPAFVLLRGPQGPAAQAGDSAATQGSGVRAVQAPATGPGDLNQSSLQGGPHFPPVGHRDFSAPSHSGSGGRGGCGAGWGWVGAAEVTGVPGSPGDLLERRGQAGQVEGPWAAVAADELPSVPTHGALILILLTQEESTSFGGRRGARPPESPQNCPLAGPSGHPGPLTCSLAPQDPLHPCSSSPCILPGPPL